MQDCAPSRDEWMPPVSPSCPTLWLMRTYYVYIMASRSRVLYAGVTNDRARKIELIERRNPAWVDLTTARAKDPQ
jgi:predicted GIY-YIG superfamily endonuclease